jgi:hypothetical protein
LYKDQPINQESATKLKLINDEINKVQGELDNQKVLNALANNSDSNLDLLRLDTAVINSTAKVVGAKTNVALSSGQKAFLNAIGVLKKARKDQMKKLDLYNKSMSANGNSDRAAKVLSASKNFSIGLTHPISGSFSKGKGNETGSSGGTSKGKGNETGSSEGTSGLNFINDNKSNFKDKFRHDGNEGNFNSYNSGSSSGNRPSASKSGTDNTNDKTNAISSDERLLAEAIEARDRANKGKYQSKEDQTIFEKVTNAYIRNYDKVLIKKNDKDAGLK